MSAGDLNLSLILKLVDRATAPARAVISNIQRANSAVETAGRNTMAWANRNLDAANANRAAMRGKALETLAVGAALAALVKPSVDVEAAMAGVKKVITFQNETTALAALQNDLLALNTSGGIPMTTEGLAEIIELAGQAGVIDKALPDAEKRAALVAFAADAARMGVAFDIAAGEAGAAMTMWRSRLMLTQTEAVSMGDAVNHLSNNMDASAAAILNVINRQGAFAKANGVMTSDIAALSAAFVAAAPSSEIAATGMKNFLSTLTKGAAVTDNEARIFKTLGIDATELARRMQEDAQGAIIDVMERLAELPEHAKAASLAQLFGEESIGAIAPLLTNLDLLRGSFGLVANESAFAGSMLAEYASQSDTTRAALKRVTNYARGLAVTIGATLLPQLNELLSRTMPMIGAAREWAAANPELVRTIVMVTAGLLALKIATLATRWAFLTMVVPVLHLVRAGGFLMVLLPRIAALLVSLLNPMALVRLAAVSLRSALLFSGVGAVIAGLALGGLWIYNNWAGLKEFFAGFGAGLRAALGPAGPLIDGVIAKARALLDWVRDITGPLDLSGEAWRNWGEQAGSALGGIITRISEWTSTSPAFLAGIAKLTLGLWLLRKVLRLPARLVFGSFRTLGRAARGAGRVVAGLIGIIARLAGLAPLKWAKLIPAIRWAALAGALKWASLIPLLKWTARMIPVIGWLALAGGLAWRLLIKDNVAWRAFIDRIDWPALAGPLSWAALIAPLLWIMRVPLIAWGALAGRLAWSALVAPLVWTAGRIPAIRWLAAAGVLAWPTLITALKWTARFIPAIGWAVLAGQLLWSLLLSKLPWKDWIPDIDWTYWFSFRWVDKLPKWNWAAIIPEFNLGSRLKLSPNIPGASGAVTPGSAGPPPPDSALRDLYGLDGTPPGMDGPLVQPRALGGGFNPGWLLTGEKGPELEYRNRGGFIAHNMALRSMLAMSNRARSNVMAAGSMVQRGFAPRFDMRSMLAMSNRARSNVMAAGAMVQKGFAPRIDVRPAMRGTAGSAGGTGGNGPMSVTFHITQAPGQSGKDLADEVMRLMKTAKPRPPRGAELHDGGDYDVA